jgi:hypothetical protein
MKTLIFRRPLTNNVLSSLGLGSGFYAVLSKAAQSGLASNAPTEDLEIQTKPPDAETIASQFADKRTVQKNANLM